MKILHIITSLELGGAEKLLTELIPLQKREAQVDLLVLYDKENFFHLDSRVSRYNSKKSIKNVFEILRVIKKGDYDIVHAHLLHAQLWTAIARRFDFTPKRKYITTEHSTSNSRREKAIFRYFDRFLFSSYCRVVSISAAVKKSLMDWLEDERVERYPVIENGIDLKLFYKGKGLDREEIGIAQGETALIMVARLNRAKDHMTLLRAMKILPLHYKLILAGEGEKGEEIQRAIEKMGLQQRVRLLGMRTDIADLFHTADVAVHSSHFEGFGITAVEAMASGIPLIASDVPGLGEVVRGGGLLFAPGDEKELAEKIISLEDENYRKMVSEREVEHSKKYSLEKTAQEYLELYKELL
ncbi:MAG: glycosyltransferase [Fusobacteriaceae bacterium]